MKFSNIDWDNNRIRLNQVKTKKLVELPLLREVGEAIVNYLYVRPSSDLPFVFLNEKPPYNGILPQTVSKVVSGIMVQSAVDIKSKRHGPHSMRHSLASRLLKKGNSLPLISEILGHSSTDSTKYYLRIDYDTLLTCSIPVPEVPEDFYNQDGGVFYD